MRNTRLAAASGLVLVALAAGRPVIATDCPGTRGYVPFDAGVLVPPGDEQALAAVLA